MHNISLESTFHWLSEDLLKFEVDVGFTSNRLYKNVTVTSGADRLKQQRKQQDFTPKSTVQRRSPADGWSRFDTIPTAADGLIPGHNNAALYASRGKNPYAVYRPTLCRKRQRSITKLNHHQSQR